MCDEDISFLVRSLFKLFLLSWLLEMITRWKQTLKLDEDDDAIKCSAWDFESEIINDQRGWKKEPSLWLHSSAALCWTTVTPTTRHRPRFEQILFCVHLCFHRQSHSLGTARYLDIYNEEEFSGWNGQMNLQERKQGRWSAKLQNIDI